MSIRILNVNRLQIALQLLNDLKIIIKIKSKWESKSNQNLNENQNQIKIKIKMRIKSKSKWESKSDGRWYRVFGTNGWATHKKGSSDAQPRQEFYSQIKAGSC
jgi:nuclear transport factor 2 (NTF2) superfamily protein